MRFGVAIHGDEANRVLARELHDADRVRFTPFVGLPLDAFSMAAVKSIERNRRRLKTLAMSVSPRNRPPPTIARIGAVAFVVCYFAAAFAVGWGVRPVTTPWMIGIVLAPGLFAFLAGIPKVVRTRPRGIMALFHLLVFPTAAVVTLGLPGAYVAWQVSQRFGG